MSVEKGYNAISAASGIVVVVYPDSVLTLDTDVPLNFHTVTTDDVVRETK